MAGILKILMNAESLTQTYTFVTRDTIAWLILIPACTIIALAGIWLAKKWGLILALVVFVVVLSLDLYYRVWLHALVASIAFALLGFFCWQSREYFRRE
jgi:hypothetical protein